MPRLKTQSEVATLRYLRENTPVPVPTVYHYDSNPYNRLGGEYILMSKVRLDNHSSPWLSHVHHVTSVHLGPGFTTFKSIPFHAS
jgi:aminoglycoside phosphotransferase (APT) family kinase protein